MPYVLLDCDDSIPERELAETKHKAAGLVKIFQD
jgi:anthranilate/para-aminobenzoate synthase component I